MNMNVLIKEKYGTTEKENLIVTSQDKQKIDIIECTSVTNSIYDNFYTFWRAVLLPTGWPDSVSEDYLSYQIWDSIQAACSGVTGALATRAVLTGVGVGDATATPLAAAISWILKDGTGLVGRILFAWWKGTGLDSDCKKWRLFADFLNDCAMCIELTIPFIINYSTYLLCFSTTMKAVVGVAGGATRASIIQHQALRGNTGDVAAKDASQETCVNLCASILAVTLLMIFSEGQFDWPLFIIFTLFHLLSNYFAVKSLLMSTLNEARLLIILKSYFQQQIIPTVKEVNKKESVIVGFGVKAVDTYNFNIVLGSSLKNIAFKISTENMSQLIKIYQGNKFMLIPDTHNKNIYIVFSHRETSVDVLTAYYNAIFLAFAICYYNNIHLDIIQNKKNQQETPLTRLKEMLKICFGTLKERSKESEIPWNVIARIKQFNEHEFSIFHKSLLKNGWKLDNHLLQIDEWRAEWNVNDKKLYTNTCDNTKRKKITKND